MNRDKKRLILMATDGKFFSADFIRKDGKKRRIIARLGVKKHLKGGVKKTLPDNLVTVWDTMKCQYRIINLDTLIHFKCKGEEIDWKK